MQYAIVTGHACISAARATPCLIAFAEQDCAVCHQIIALVPVALSHSEPQPATLQGTAVAQGASGAVVQFTLGPDYHDFRTIRFRLVGLHFGCRDRASW